MSPPRVTAAAYARTIPGIINGCLSRCGWPRALFGRLCAWILIVSRRCARMKHARCGIVRIKLCTAPKVSVASDHDKCRRRRHLNSGLRKQSISKDRQCLSWQQHILPNPSGASRSPGQYYNLGTATVLTKAGSECVRRYRPSG